LGVVLGGKYSLQTEVPFFVLTLKAEVVQMPFFLCSLLGCVYNVYLHRTVPPNLAKLLPALSNVDHTQAKKK
jgi:hypothetical protein